MTAHKVAKQSAVVTLTPNQLFKLHLEGGFKDQVNVVHYGTVMDPVDIIVGDSEQDIEFLTSVDLDDVSTLVAGERGWLHGVPDNVWIGLISEGAAKLRIRGEN